MNNQMRTVPNETTYVASNPRKLGGGTESPCVFDPVNSQSPEPQRSVNDLPCALTWCIYRHASREAAAFDSPGFQPRVTVPDSCQAAERRHALEEPGLHSDFATVVGTTGKLLV